MSTSSDTPDAQSCAGQSNDDLLDQMMDAFWSVENNSLTIHSKHRMGAVVALLADKIRSWAPDPGQAKICHLAINEVADRLIRDTTTNSP